MRYEIICSQKVLGLEDDVNRLIEKGFEPIGGVCFSFYTVGKYKHETYLYQAMLKPKPRKTRKASKVEYTAEFEALWEAYPKRPGNNPKGKAFTAYKKQLLDHVVSYQGNLRHNMLAGTRRYSDYCDATNKTGTEYVLQTATFLGPEKHYENEWEVDVKLRLPKSDDELVQWAEMNDLPDPAIGEKYSEYRRRLEGLL